MIGYNCGTQYSTEQLDNLPLSSRQSSTVGIETVMLRRTQYADSDGRDEVTMG